MRKGKSSHERVTKTSLHIQKQSPANTASWSLKKWSGILLAHRWVTAALSCEAEVQGAGSGMHSLCSEPRILTFVTLTFVTLPGAVHEQIRQQYQCPHRLTNCVQLKLQDVSGDRKAISKLYGQVTVRVGSGLIKSWRDLDPTVKAL